MGHAAEEQCLAARLELLSAVNLCLWLESDGSKWPVQMPVRTRACCYAARRRARGGWQVRVSVVLLIATQFVLNTELRGGASR